MGMGTAVVGADKKEKQYKRTHVCQKQNYLFHFTCNVLKQIAQMWSLDKTTQLRILNVNMNAHRWLCTIVGYKFT